MGAAIVTRRARHVDPGSYSFGDRYVIGNSVDGRQLNRSEKENSSVINGQLEIDSGGKLLLIRHLSAMKT